MTIWIAITRFNVREFPLFFYQVEHQLLNKYIALKSVCLAFLDETPWRN